ncbi:MAG: D-alanine--D-alanine ligase family protein [Candidatus Scatovivens sp.]
MIKLGIFFGGKSVEHEISVITMSQAIASIDESKYEIVPIYISKQGVMYTGDDLLDLYQYKDIDVLLKRSYKVAVVNNGKRVEVIRIPAPIVGKRVLNTIDVAFPIIHGTNGEDGTIAAFINLLGIPCVGPDILSSSIGMDKIIMKKVMKESGLPVVDYVSFYSMEYNKDEDKFINEIEEKINYPVIVKPANLGSSVGIKKAKNKQELTEAIDFAMEFSDRILVEKAIENLKEINCSVIGDIAETEASVCEEPCFEDDILSYTDKYMAGGKTNSKGIKGMLQKSGGKGMAVSNKKLPADISDEKREEIQKLAKETFKVLGCSGVSRVDFLIDKDTDTTYVNEINTIPGALSYYLWEASGKTFTQELDEVIDIAIRKHEEKEKLTVSYDQNILAMQGPKMGSKGKMKGV